MTDRKLYHKDGSEVRLGDKVTSFRGETATVTGWDKRGRNRVYVKWHLTDDAGNLDLSSDGEYFASVFNLHWQD